MNATLIFTALVLGAPALKDRDTASQLYGTWVMEETAEEARVRAIERRDGPYRYRFNRDGTWQVFRGDKEVAERRNFLFNATADPPTIDFNTPPRPKNSDLILGIYKIEGDRLTICCSYPDRPRPTEFATAGGIYVQKLRRKKD
jgi:uncharacterized protein (TIGR03067 family)